MRRTVASWLSRSLGRKGYCRQPGNGRVRQRLVVLRSEASVRDEDHENSRRRRIFLHQIPDSGAAAPQVVPFEHDDVGQKFRQRRAAIHSVGGNLRLVPAVPQPGLQALKVIQVAIGKQNSHRKLLLTDGIQSIEDDGQDSAQGDSVAACSIPQGRANADNPRTASATTSSASATERLAANRSIDGGRRASDLSDARPPPAKPDARPD